MAQQDSIGQEIHEILNSLRARCEHRKRAGLRFIARPEALETDSGRTSAAEPDKEGCLIALQNEIGPCQRCGLHAGRTHIVFGEGNPDAGLMFVGEAPGRDEDLSGHPFVGRAGQLLTRIIQAINLERRDVYIANIIKCRPPDNRDPEPEEIQTCFPFLERQIDIIRPKVICALGRIAAQVLLDTRAGITGLRGRFYERNGIKIMPTYHPSYLLRNEGRKKETWIDMQMVQKEL